MSSSKKVKPAIWLMAILAFTGVLCYAAFPPEIPGEPPRVMLKATAGDVLFSHQTHAEDYEIDCLTCHHNIEEDEEYSCGACHEAESEDEDMLARTDAFHMQCIQCHEEEGAGPEGEACAQCHRTR